MHTIVVGVDGSEPSLNALRFAIAEARMYVESMIMLSVRPPARVCPAEGGLGW